MAKQKTKPTTRKAWIALAITLIVSLATIIWVAMYSLGSDYHSANVPHPLGEKLEYIGKVDYGCTGGLCSAGPGSTYYYGTSISVEEVVQYFGKAQQNHPVEQRSEYTSILLQNKATALGFEVTFYENGAAKREEIHLNGAQQHVLGISARDYDTAKDSL